MVTDKTQKGLLLICLLLGWMGIAALAADEQRTGVGSMDTFHQGLTNYSAGKFTNAVACFRAETEKRASPGAWYNLGNAEWQLGRVGPAVLAWERARWIDPFNASARGNLDYARKTARLDQPEPAWYELCSSWLPASWWPWLAAICFWGAAAGWILPVISRKAKGDWRQGLTAAGLAGFLLVLPALAGVHSRAKLGVVLDSTVPMRLAPAQHAQTIATLHAGETVRRERQEGSFYFVRAANDASGWIGTGQVAWIVAQP